MISSIFLFGIETDYLPYFLIVMFILGAVIGSFLNVVIYRLPLKQSIVFPNSRCPKCQKAIKPYDNIPIFSWLILLRGKCRACKAPISIRYPAVEALTGLLYVAVFYHAGLSFALPFELILVTALVPLIFIDADHQILPNKITYPLFVFAIVSRVVLPLLMNKLYFDDLTPGFIANFSTMHLWAVSLIGGLIGAIAGGGFLWVVGFLWEKLRGIEAMGLGDVKLMLGLGAFMGWRLTLLTIFLGCLTGALAGLIKKLKDGDLNLEGKLPFGIFLGAGTIISLLYGIQIINWYISNFIP